MFLYAHMEKCQDVNIISYMNMEGCYEALSWCCKGTVSILTRLLNEFQMNGVKVTLLNFTAKGAHL